MRNNFEEIEGPQELMAQNQFRMGQSLARAGAREQAAAMFQRIEREFPGSRAAAEAMKEIRTVRH